MSSGGDRRAARKRAFWWALPVLVAAGIRLGFALHDGSDYGTDLAIVTIGVLGAALLLWVIFAPMALVSKRRRQALVAVIQRANPGDLVVVGNPPPDLAVALIALGGRLEGAGLGLARIALSVGRAGIEIWTGRHSTPVAFVPWQRAGEVHVGFVEENARTFDALAIPLLPAPSEDDAVPSARPCPNLDELVLRPTPDGAWALAFGSNKQAGAVVARVAQAQAEWGR